MVRVQCSDQFITTMKKVPNRIHLLKEEDLLTLIDANTEVVIVAPWNGQPIPIVIRMLDSVSLSSCGDFNLASTILELDEEEVSNDDIIKTKNIHENMLKLALVTPSFKLLEKHLMGKDFYKQRQEEIDEVKVLIEQVDKSKEKRELTEKLEMLELSIAFLVPEDFTAFVITVLLQREATDLNKLTRDTLLKCGFLAEKYNVRPSTYLEGTFTEKQNVDIDLTALTLVSDYREQQNVEKSGMKWIRGKNKNA